MRLLVVAALLSAGWLLRTVEPGELGAAVGGPWTRTIVTLYFADGPYLFPLSRRMPRDAELPRKALEALLAGPGVTPRLNNPVPSGLALRAIRVSEGVARVDLSGSMETLRAGPTAIPAIVATLTHLPGIDAADVRVDDVSVTNGPVRIPLVYYPSANGVIAFPLSASAVRAALDAFLAGPPDVALTGIPRDAHLLGYEFNQTKGLVSLQFAYTPSVRTLAIERPDQMRFLLLGLIATLTDVRGVRAVQLDFGGQTRLGLGQCSDLLRTPQQRPALLNDERLVGRNRL